jgi:hypothetical protein
MKSVIFTFFLLLAYPLQAQNQHAGGGIRQVALGDRSTNISNVRGNVYVTNIYVVCIVGDREQFSNCESEISELVNANSGAGDHLLIEEAPTTTANFLASIYQGISNPPSIYAGNENTGTDSAKIATWQPIPAIFTPSQPAYSLSAAYGVADNTGMLSALVASSQPGLSSPTAYGVVGNNGILSALVISNQPGLSSPTAYGAMDSTGLLSALVASSQPAFSWSSSIIYGTANTVDNPGIMSASLTSNQSKVFGSSLPPVVVGAMGTVDGVGITSLSLTSGQPAFAWLPPSLIIHKTSDVADTIGLVSALVKSSQRGAAGFSSLSNAYTEVTNNSSSFVTMPEWGPNANIDPISIVGLQSSPTLK